MTDLISKRNLGRHSIYWSGWWILNLDVLGSRVTWSVFIQWKKEYALKTSSKRRHTFCWNSNACQLMMELELITPEHEVHGKWNITIRINMKGFTL
jgi:phosphoribosylformylglycinamidine synthase